MNIDHHLQLSMIKMLASSDTHLSYTTLKEDGIENSLFSYHLNKLIQRKMVMKHDDGYSLTIEGARWLNDNGMKIHHSESPRVFVAIVIKNDKGEYLIGQRTGQFKETINDYIFPSLPYENLLDIADQIKRTISEFITKESLKAQTDFGFLQIKASYRDGTVMRLLFSVTLCNVTEMPAMTKNDIEYEWLALEDIKKVDHPSAEILRQIIDLTGDKQKAHSTLLIQG